MFYKKNKGFTLIEIMLVLVVMMSITLIKIKDINNDVMKTQSEFLANNIKTVASATNALIVMKYSELSNLTSSSGITCATANQTCSVSIDTLKNNNLLPPNFSSNSVLGKPYEIQIKRSGTSPNFMVSGLVLTSGVPTNDVSANQVLLGNTIQSIGTDGGINKTAGQISGSYGSWKADSTVFPMLAGKKDYVGAVVGNLSGAYYVYLRRDGTLPMTGSLSLGGNDITNVRTLTATGNISTGGVISAGGNIQAKNGYGDIISIGGDAANNDYEIILHSQKPLSIHSPSSASYTTILNVNRNMTISQRLGLMGKDPNDIPSGWSGGLRTADVYADGTIGAGTGRNVNAYLNKDGKIFATGNIEGGTITSKGRLITEEYLQINGLAVAGAVCETNGLQGKDNNGVILSCISGKWGSSASGFFKAPLPQEINCTPKNQRYGVSARIDESGAVYTRYANGSWVRGAVNITAGYGGNGDNVILDIAGFTYTGSFESCPNNDICEIIRYSCRADWKY